MRTSLVPLLVIGALLPAGVAWTNGFPDGIEEAYGEKFGGTAISPKPTNRTAPPESRPRDLILRWNEIMLDANALDHTPVAPDENRVFGEQIGPGRTARAMAIVQIAVFDAMNAIVGNYQSYTDLAPVQTFTSAHAAVAQASHDTLAALYPSQAARFDHLLNEDLAMVPNWFAKANGIKLGQRAAAKILALTIDDGSNHPEPVIGVDFFTSDQPGKWRQDPISQVPIAMGAYWGHVTPFVMQSGDQLLPPAPPALDSPEYTAAFDEVKRLGGDGIVTQTERTEEQTLAGIYWAYDGTPGVGTPPRLFNQIVTQIAEQKGLNAMQLARVLALANVAMADAGISCWEKKYLAQFWRPITAIRESDPGFGPTGLGDGNSNTVGDPNWMPLGAPSSNHSGAPNFTPPFPAYASGHASFGGAVFQVLRRFYRTDNIAFTFVSDELNGVTQDNLGNARSLAPRSFSTFSQAEEENGQSRIYLGIHWSFDKTEGITNGRAIGDYVFDHGFRPKLQAP